MNNGHHIIIRDDKGRREISLDKAVYSMGRSSTCDIRLFSPYVSNYHATLLPFLKGRKRYLFYRIIDGSLDGKRSKWGIWVHNQRVTNYILIDTDTITFASGVSVTYYYGDYSCKRVEPGYIFPENRFYG